MTNHDDLLDGCDCKDAKPVSDEELAFVVLFGSVMNDPARVRERRREWELLFL